MVRKHRVFLPHCPHTFKWIVLVHMVFSASNNIISGSWSSYLIIFYKTCVRREIDLGYLIKINVNTNKLKYWRIPRNPTIFAESVYCVYRSNNGIDLSVPELDNWFSNSICNPEQTAIGQTVEKAKINVIMSHVCSNTITDARWKPNYCLLNCCW
jgi:hypothetical protein